MTMIGPASRRGDKVVGRLEADASAEAFFAKAWRQAEQTKHQLGTGMDSKTAAQLVAQYGDRGTLPKGLDRDTKKAAYEARWVHSGGKAKQKWQRRAEVSNAVTTGALAAGGLSAGVELAARTKRGSAALDRLGGRAARTPVLRRVTGQGIRRAAGHAGLASAALGASSELYRRRAAGKAKTYASAPGGVAAGALRRMEAYDKVGKSFVADATSRDGAGSYKRAVDLDADERATVRRRLAMGHKPRGPLHQRHHLDGARAGRPGESSNRSAWVRDEHQRVAYSRNRPAEMRTSRLSSRSAKTAARFGKAARETSWTGALKVQMSDAEARRTVERHGATGSLPRNLSREDKIKAYEARYIHHGGRKRDRAQRTSNIAGSIYRPAAAIGVGSAAGLAAMHHPVGAGIIATDPRLSRHAPRARKVLLVGAIGGGATAAVSGGVRTMANRRVKRYQSMPSGTAAGALRRMYSEQERNR